MGDGLGDATRGAEALLRIEVAAAELAAALDAVRDEVFGYSVQVLDTVNHELRRTKVRVVIKK